MNKIPPADAGDTGSIPSPERLPMPQSSEAPEPQLWKPGDAGAHAPLQAEPTPREVCAGRLGSSQLVTAGETPTQQQGSTAGS